MKNDHFDLLKKHPSAGGFIKSAETPIDTLSSEQKVQLNRRGNILFNEGDIQGAMRLFLTTGYSDGLNRIADKYSKDGDDLSALKLYTLSHNRKKAEMIIEKIASVVSQLLNEED